MNQRWFSNRAQIVQTFAGVASLGVAGTAFYINQVSGKVPESVWTVLVAVILATLLVSVFNLWVGWTKPVSTLAGSLEVLVSPSPVSVPTPEPKLAPLSVYPDPDDKSEIVWKMKLRVVLRNDSEDCIDVENVQWIAGAGDIVTDPRSPRLWCRLQLQRANERQLGSGGWQSEETEIHVRPDETFRVSIALDPGADTKIKSDEIRQRLNAQRTGTLMLRLKMARRVKEWELRL